MVSNASEDLPEPESPVKTINLSLGIIKSIFFKLFSLAPFIIILLIFILLFILLTFHENISPTLLKKILFNLFLVYLFRRAKKLRVRIPAFLLRISFLL